MTMTETEWLTCNDPMPMLACLDGQVSNRKLALFACACCQLFCPQVVRERYLRLLDAAERCAAGLATRQDLDATADSCRDRYWRPTWQLGESSDLANISACRAILAATLAASATDPQRVWTETREARAFAVDAARERLGQGMRAREWQRQCELLREIFGNPFHFPEVLVNWSLWNERTIPRLVTAIDQNQAFDRLPILADALEDAGCREADILTHCRQGEPHVRGCWVIDLLLQRE
jgi:hypothetical protein